MITIVDLGCHPMASLSDMFLAVGIDGVTIGTEECWKLLGTSVALTNRELGNELWTRQLWNLLIKNQGGNNNELAPDKSTLSY